LNQFICLSYGIVGSGDVNNKWPIPASLVQRKSYFGDLLPCCSWFMGSFLAPGGLSWRQNMVQAMV